MDYFKHKSINKLRAIEHTKEVSMKYYKQIVFSIENATVYDEEACRKLLDRSTTRPDDFTRVVKFEKSNTVDALFAAKKKGKRIAVLNFASFKNPGGMFMEGSSAQEEHLCHESTLYPVLESFDKSFYEYNREHKNKALYRNRCLYTPDIVFTNSKGKERMADVITIAAPNAGAARKNDVSEDIIEATMAERIKIIYEIAVDKKIDILILGAFGCGVFKNDPYVTAKQFAEIGNSYFGNTLVFAIPDDKHFDIFRNIISNYFFTDGFEVLLDELKPGTNLEIGEF